MTTAAASDFLRGMAASSQVRFEQARMSLSDSQLRSQLMCVDPARPLYLAGGQFDVIAEIKKRSPAEGELDGALSSPAAQAEAYVAGGAALLSVLTEPEQFRGSLDDLQAVVAMANTTPVMRKDFLVAPYQVCEARLAGASGVLLIAGMLEPDRLEAMLEQTLQLGMFALVEVFGAVELDACMPVLERMGPALADTRCHFMLGVNCRNLRTLKVDFQHFERMAPLLPAALPWVAESGLTEPAQAQELAQLGYRMALVGTTLMRSTDPAGTVAAIRAQGAAVCS